MGTESNPSVVKLFVAVLYNPASPIDEVLAQLDRKFGERQFSHGPVPFSWSEYYKDEMGDSLYKIYYNYKIGIERQLLPEIKLFTNKLEKQTADSCGNRLINIDPGYVARDKVVLATTKDFYHRLYLADGIFGEVTLHYRKGKFRYFSWTYPDFRDEAVMTMLERVRAPMVKELRAKESSEKASTLPATRTE